MDTKNITKVKFNIKKERIDDDDKIFQENIIQKKQIRKRKRKSTVQEIEGGSLKHSKQIRKQVSNVPADIIIKEEANENDIIIKKEANGNDIIIKKEAFENGKTPTKPSKRQLKRERVIQIANQKKESSRINTMKKALNYVSMWKHSRSEWKFEKLKQIWLMDNLLDENSISDIIFPLVLEYFEGCKGMAREVLLRKGMDVIKKAEENDEEIKNEITESVAYKRARQLLQILPSDK